MIKIYKYKIQWIFSNNMLNFTKFINIIGVKSLDKINLMNNNYKIIDSYNSFSQYPNEKAEKETIKYIRKQIKENDNIRFIEVLRRWYQRNI